MPQYHVEATWQVIQTHTINADSEEQVWDLLKDWAVPDQLTDEDTVTPVRKEFWRK